MFYDFQPPQLVRDFALPGPDGRRPGGRGHLATSVTAAERQTKTKTPFGKYNPDDETIDLFQGMKDGQLEVKFIPKDSTQASVQIANKSKKPLNVKLPEAFAAAPV